MALNVGQLYVDLKLRDDQYRAGLNQAKNSAKQSGEQAGNSFTAGMTSKVKRMAQGAGLVGAGLVMGRMLMEGFRAGMDTQTAEKTLSGLYDSGDKAKKMLQDISRVSKSSPLSTATYQKAAETLAYTGVEGEKAVAIMENVGKAITAVGGSEINMGRATDGLMKIVNAGKVTLDSLQQISMAGVPIISGLAEHFGVSMEEINRMATNGQVQLSDVLSVMENATGSTFQSMVQAGENASKSFGNQWKIARDNIVQAIGRGITPILQSLTPVMSGVAEGARIAGGGFEGLAKMVTGIPGPLKMMLGIMAAVKVASMALGTEMGQRFAAKLAAGRAAMVGWATGAQRIAVQTQMGAVQMGRFGTAIAQVGQRMPIVARMQSSFLNAATGAQRFGRMAGVAAAASTGLRGAASGVVSMLGGPWGVALAVAGGALMTFQQRQQNMQQHQENIKTAAKGVADALHESATQAGKSADQIGGYGQQAAAAALEQAKLITTGESLASVLENIGVNGSLAAQGLAGNKEAAAATLRDLEAAADKRAEEAKTHADVSGAQALWNWVTKGDTGDNKAKTALNNYKQLMDEIQQQQDAIKREAANGGFELEVATDGTVELNKMAQAMKEFESNTKGAASSVDLLTKALTGLTDDSLTLHDAQAKVNESIRDMEELAGTLGEVGLDASNMIDTTTEAGAKADKVVREYSEGLKQSASAMYEAGLRGGELTSKLQPMYEQFLTAAEGMGLSREQAEAVAHALGIIPEQVVTNLSVKDDANSKALLDEIQGKILAMPDAKTIHVSSLTEEAQAKLESLGFKVRQIPGTKNFELIADNPNAMNALDLLRGKVDGIPPVKPVTITTPGYETVMAGLAQLGIEVHSNNEKHIVITDTSAENIARLNDLGIRTTTLPDGTVVISDNSIDVANNIDARLAGKTTHGTHTITVNEVLGSTVLGRAFPGSVNANGSIRQRAAGALDQAQIRGGSGNGIVQMSPLGPVRWAESETGWEAYIPGARSKRGRALKILRTVAERFGLMMVPEDAVMADGGIRSADEIDQFARGIEGHDYVFGGSGSWNTDCSGGVSAVVNYAVGQDPFGSRTGTATMGQFLAERGFLPGLGGPGTLSVGWVNGGPGGGHTAATLPNGVNVEMGGARGNGQYGGQAAGAADPQFTDHMHLPIAAGDAGDGLQGAAPLTEKQQIAATIIEEGRARGMSDKQIRAALATGLAESDLSNINYGDRDSVGVFQQRDNGAWGTYEDRMDPKRSAGMFYDELAKLDPDSMSEAQLAQAVQKSAFADGSNYQAKMEEADALLREYETRGSAGASGSMSTSGSGNPVYVTNWPAGLGASTGSSLSSLSAPAPVTTSAPAPAPIQEVVDENPPEIEGPDWDEAGRKVGTSFGEGILSDLGVGTSGVIGTLIKKLPDIDKLNQESDFEAAGRQVQQVINIYTVDVEDALRKVREQTQVDRLGFKGVGRG